MTLEELLQAMNEAKAKAEAAPTDKVLQTEFAKAKKAYEDAKAESESEEEESEEEEEESEEFDESKSDARTKKYLEKLRKENAKHRTKAKDLASQVSAEKKRVNAILKAAGLESEEEKPEEKVKALTAQTQNQAFRTAILESAIEHGIPKEGLKYYQFLVSEAAAELEEGEELPEEKIAEIVAECKKGRSGKKADSSVGGKGGSGGDTPPAGGGKEITLEKFCSMSMVEKSKLYESNRDLYVTLVQQAKLKKKLV